MRPTYAEINLGKLRSNIRVLRKAHGDRSFFCPMVKANAYGHGDVEVSKAIIQEGVRFLGVILVEEGIRLRQNGIANDTDILVFGFHDKEALEACFLNHLTPVIGSFESLNALKVASKQHKVKIHIKFNSGMSRLGFQPEEAGRVLEFLNSNPYIELEGICTHFLNGEDATDEGGYTVRQMKVFAEIEDMFKGRYVYSHCLNSGALASGFKGTTNLHLDKNHLGARPGIAVYGYPPESSDIAHDIFPVMSLRSAIVQVRSILKGDHVSYGATWKAQRESIVATLCIGYGDGYPRNLSNNSSVLFRQTRVPIIGRVCMDYLVIDLTDFKNEPEIKMGEQVTMWGYQNDTLLSAEELARNMNTISYELITRVSPRVPRVYIDS